MFVVAELSQRLKRHTRKYGSSAAAESSCDEPAEDDEDGDKVSDAGSVSSSDSEDSTLELSSLGMLELREECRKRGLAQYGTKQGVCYACEALGILDDTGHCLHDY